VSENDTKRLTPGEVTWRIALEEKVKERGSGVANRERHEVQELAAARKA
jgi:hypothetical protein